jgi:hypothetical protein
MTINIRWEVEGWLMTKEGGMVVVVRWGAVNVLTLSIVPPLTLEIKTLVVVI